MGAEERTGAHEGDTQGIPLPSRVSLARAGPFFLAPMYFLSAYYATLALGAREFSSAISGFCQVLVVTRYPGYQRLFLACDQELRRPQSDEFRVSSSPGPLYQNEVSCSTFDMEQAMEMIFHSRANKTHFHKKG